MSHEPTKLVLGRGEVYFDRFIDGTRIGEGERYLGNTTSFRVQRDIRTRERSTSYRGKVVQKDPLVLSETHSVDFITDHIDAENVAMWFGSSISDQVFSTGLISETFSIKRGRYFQIGKSLNVVGVRGISFASVTFASSVIPSEGNYKIDYKLGRIWIEPNAPAIPNGATLTISFRVRASDATRLVSAPKQVKGSLRFVAFNEGPMNRQAQNDIFIPFVTLSPRGQVDLKGDEWQQWGFEGQITNLNTSTEQVYVLGGAKTLALTDDERAVIAAFGSLDNMLTFEDQLHQSVNFGWPPALEIGVI